MQKGSLFQIECCFWRSVYLAVCINNVEHLFGVLGVFDFFLIPPGFGFERPPIFIISSYPLFGSVFNIVFHVCRLYINVLCTCALLSYRTATTMTRHKLDSAVLSALED